MSHPQPGPTSQATDAASEEPPPAGTDAKSPSVNLVPTAQGNEDDPPLPPTPTNQDQSEKTELKHTAEENLPNTPQDPSAPVLTVGSTTYKYFVDLASNLVIASQTAIADEPAISVSGIQIGLVSAANSIVVDVFLSKRKHPPQTHTSNLGTRS